MLTGKDIFLIEEALNDMATTDESFFTADLSFHLALLRASNNPLWLKFGMLMPEAFVQSFRQTYSVADLDHIVAVYRNVPEANRLRNGDAARQSMRGLLEEAELSLKTRKVTDG